MYKVVKILSNINIEINLWLEDIAFSMVYTKFLIRYYIGGCIHFASECYKQIKNPNNKIINNIMPLLGKKFNIDNSNQNDTNINNCENCGNEECEDFRCKKDSNDTILYRQEEIHPNTVDEVDISNEEEVKPVFNKDMINSDIFIKYREDEIEEAKVISNHPEAETDLNKVMKAIAISEDIVNALKDQEIHYDDINKLNKLNEKLNRLYDRAKILSKEEHLRKKREMMENLVNNMLDEEM